MDFTIWLGGLDDVLKGNIKEQGYGSFKGLALCSDDELAAIGFKRGQIRTIRGECALHSAAFEGKTADPDSKADERIEALTTAITNKKSRPYTEYAMGVFVPTILCPPNTWFWPHHYATKSSDASEICHNWRQDCERWLRLQQVQQFHSARMVTEFEQAWIELENWLSLAAESDVSLTIMRVAYAVIERIIRLAIEAKRGADGGQCLSAFQQRMNEQWATTEPSFSTAYEAALKLSEPPRRNFRNFKQQAAGGFRQQHSQNFRQQQQSPAQFQGQQYPSPQFQRRQM